MTETPEERSKQTFDAWYQEDIQGSNQVPETLIATYAIAIREAEERGRVQEREMCKFIVTQSILSCDVYLSEFGTMPDGLTIGQAIMIAIDDRDQWLAADAPTTEESQGQPTESG